MKKLLSLLIIGSILGVNIFTGFLGNSIKITYAGSIECSIEDGTPELERYIAEIRKQTQKTIYNIVKSPEYNPALNDKLKKKQRAKDEKENGTDITDSFDNIEEEYEKTKSQVKNYLWGQGKKVYEIGRDLFRMTPSWDAYVLSFGFWLGAIRYDYSLPIAVKRDFDMIRDEGERIKIYMDNLINSGINADPEFDKNSYIVGLPGLLELNKLVEYAFMAAIIEGFSSDTQAMLQAQKAKQNLEEYIGKYNINLSTDFLSEYTSIIKNEECRQSADPIEDIIETWEGGFDGVFEDWKEAFDLAMGLSGQGTFMQKYKMRKRKRELLKDLYGKLPAEEEKVDKFFSNMTVENSLKRLNPISDTTEQEFDNFMQYIDQLSDTYNDFENKIMPNGYTPIEAKDLKNNSDRELSKIDKTIEIRNIYEELKYLEPGTGKEQVDLKSSILDNHKTIAEAIQYLEKTTKLAEKVCKSQGVGRGKCNSREYTK